MLNWAEWTMHFSIDWVGKRVLFSEAVCNSKILHKIFTCTPNWYIYIHIVYYIHIYIDICQSVIDVCVCNLIVASNLFFPGTTSSPRTSSYPSGSPTWRAPGLRAGTRRSFVGCTRRLRRAFSGPRRGSSRRFEVGETRRGIPGKT